MRSDIQQRNDTRKQSYKQLWRSAEIYMLRSTIIPMV